MKKLYAIAAVATMGSRTFLGSFAAAADSQEEAVGLMIGELQKKYPRCRLEAHAILKVDDDLIRNCVVRVMEDSDGEA